MALGTLFQSPEEIQIPLRLEIGKPPGTQKIAIPPGMLPF
jgi:hypothetical protein